MSFIQLLCGRFLRLIQSILAVFKRALCIFRKRENVGELPFSVKVEPKINHGLDVVDRGLPSYSAKPNDAWDNSWDQKALVEDKIEEFRRKTVEKSPEIQEEPNFFGDMVPEIKKPKKVLLKKKVSNHAEPSRNLFALNEDASVDPVFTHGAELGELDEPSEAAWEDDGIDTLLDSHKKKELEEKRKVRLQQHERHNREKAAKMAGYGYNY